MMPAAGQGAIGIECRAVDAATSALLSTIDHHQTREAVLSERAFCRALGGTCHSPVGAYAVVDGSKVLFACELLSENGQELMVEAVTFDVGDLETPAALAREMLARAPESIRRLFG